MELVSSIAQVLTAEEAAFAALGESADDPRGSTLMQRAAAGLAAVVGRELRLVAGGHYGASVLVLAGSGNNGGDALHAAARLARRGVGVRLRRTGSGVHAGGWQAALDAGAREVDADEAMALIDRGRVDLVIDGILGIGGRPGLSGEPAELARACRRCGVTVVAADLPSGLDADRPGVADDAFRATVTVTFGARKPCHVSEPAASACGRVELVDIGLEVDALAECWGPDEVAAVWPVPGPTSDKYARGVVGLDTGSRHYTGAAVLGAAGAVHAGAGMVRFTGADRAADEVIARFPNVVRANGRVQALVLGSGWGERVDAAETVAGAVASGLGVVLDADALSHLPTGPLGARVLLTPHAGELARMLRLDRTEVEADPVAAVREAVRRTGATVLLKGATQYVAVPERDRIGIAVPGPAWTGQAGSGDVLAGICGALLAAGLDPYDAALAGASVQALAAAERPGPPPPPEIAARVPAVVHALVADS